ncbi:DUF3179 domain-containing protein [Nitrosopumilus adriaticus]|uniref:DUF3179 domain-containing protein n=1 Tax=Nitrosopumilus adriaticus TaxID=1580092 RepID=A0A0D5C577_9ARCH|nr:DUF3179 domain-containing protein [Nitrosopumilus adriaticus]AJW71510.1 conserved exported protein of unknown function [Nitrosopumilus adriaticus]
MNFKVFFLIVIVGIALLAFGVLFGMYSSNQSTIENSEEPGNVTSKLSLMETNGEKHLIPLDKIKGGGPPKDGIPSIDNPVFASISDSHFMSDSDTVIGLEINGQAKAYPLFILVWHEIVNDNVGGTPVSVTYCPLCYTNQVFERTIDGQEVEFGTSGKLYNSNLLMYDRFTESYWSQALGMAVTGELSGYELNLIPFDVITWGDWKKIHPDTLVLTTETGHIRSYATDPYGNYYTEPRIMFPVENRDDRMNPKEIVIGLHQDDIYKAYKQNEIESKVVINDFVGNTPILLVSLFSENSRAFERIIDDEMLDFEYSDGKILDLQTNSEWNYDGFSISGKYQGKQLERMPIEPGFWFSWIAFHPDTLVFGDV